MRLGLMLATRGESTLRSRSGRGFFLVLEGLDGSGKTTIAKMLVKDLTNKGLKAYYSFEPWISLYVKVLKEEYSSIRDAYLDALTYACDRYIHLKLEVLKLLDEGYVVVSDRYYYSSIAYQASQNAPFEWVLTVNSIFPEPDLAILLDVDPAIGLLRKRNIVSRFPEYEDMEFLVKVRENYRRLVELGKLVLVDANAPIEDVYRRVYELFVKTYDSMMNK